MKLLLTVSAIVFLFIASGTNTFLANQACAQELIPSNESQKTAQPADQERRKPLTKSELINNMAEATGLSKKQIESVMDALNEEIRKSVATEDAPGTITIPGLCKIVVQQKPAVPKRQVRNPLTGETVWAAPKPAYNVVKIRALKGLKDMVK